MHSYSIVNGMEPLSDDAVMALPMNMTHLQNTGAPTTMVSNRTSTEDDTAVSPQVVAWCWFVIVLLCFCVRSSIPDDSARRAARDRERRQRIEHVKNDPEKRKLLIDQSLIAKVCACHMTRSWAG